MLDFIINYLSFWKKKRLQINIYGSIAYCIIADTFSPILIFFTRVQEI